MVIVQSGIDTPGRRSIDLQKLGGGTAPFFRHQPVFFRPRLDLAIEQALHPPCASGVQQHSPRTREVFGRHNGVVQREVKVLEAFSLTPGRRNA